MNAATAPVIKDKEKQVAEKSRGAPKKETKKPKAPSTQKAARREAAKKAMQSGRDANTPEE